MDKYILSTQKLDPHFIGSWTINPLSVCDDLISFFESNGHLQKSGVTAMGVKSDVKDRVDISIQPKQLDAPGHEVLKHYIGCLYACYEDYLEQWPFLSEMADCLEIGNFNIGRYQPGQHFQQLHTERSSLKTLHRVLAWMTYLNDVDQGGETYFSHFDLTIKPKKGLTLIWPAEWTHAHRGNVVIDSEKYMVTGWLTFSDGKTTTTI